ncbi:hypothetical protein C8F04DRAFT_1252188 [Mycena alexandri]|uniref:Uncharacterized protein n=1 Tax=Mycena alexandri TaxID=1745969 RepID=A0AAD6TAT2_9AGAR|nr:hypothetical protein C8F04DRAFT_1252188 [Mycena alexandri]
MRRTTCGDPDPHCGRSWSLHHARRPRKRARVPRPSRRFMRYLKQRYIAGFWARWLAAGNEISINAVTDPDEEPSTMESQVFGTWAAH